MRNLRTLFGYEMKKIWKRQLAWVMTVLMAAASVFVAQGGLQQGLGRHFYSENINDLSSGPEFISEDAWSARMQEGGMTLNGQAMDDLFFHTMGENVPEFDDYTKRNYWFYYEDPTYYHAYSMVDSTTNGDPRNVSAESFYAGRRALLELRWENYRLSEKEKDYWRAIEEQIQEPFVYEYPWRGADPNGLFSTLYTMIVPLALAAAACLCQIFSEDRSTRVNALVFASREGRMPLYLAKILAGAASTFISAALILGGHMVVYLLRYGIQGLGAPLQMLNIVYSFPISVGHAVAYMLLIVTLYTLVCGALTMLVSILSHRATFSLIVPVVLMFFLTQSRLTAPYLPHNLITWDGFLNVNLFKVFGIYLNVFQVGLLLYPLIAVVLFALCWLGWRRNATGR